MKKNLGLLFLATLTLSGLAGCSLTGENYFTIDIYSDYIGMEQDLAAHGYYTVDLSNEAAMAAVGLKKVGYCYAVKGKDAKIGGIQLVDSAFDGKTSTRTPAEGHKYVFSGFAGYYGGNKPIDLNAITANCALFATFSDELKDYAITVRDAYANNLHSELVEYGKSALDLTAEGKGELETILRSAPVHDPDADPNDYSTWRDPHYIEYAFEGWRMSVAGEKIGGGWTYDTTDKRSYMDLTADEAVAYQLKEQTRFDARYLETEKSYEVALSYQIRTFNELTGDYVYTTPVSVAPQIIPYGQAIDVDALGMAGYTCVGEGENGSPSRYGDDLNIAPSEYKAKLPAVLLELFPDGYRGTVVNRNKIQFGCALTLVFVENAPVYTLSFHPDCADPSSIVAVDVHEGDQVKAPAVTNVPAAKTFVEWGVKDEFDKLVPADLSAIQASCDLFPILVDTVIADAKMTYTFDKDKKGYLLTGVDSAATEIVAADFNLALFDANYPLVGLSSLAGAADDAKLSVLELPADNDIAWFSHGLFASSRLAEVTKIDLSTSKILALHAYSFRNLARVTEIDLPSSLYEVGTSQFLNCSSLTKVDIGLTKEEVAERNFDPNWYSGVDESVINYKS